MATIAASADIPDELTMFNDLEKETLKLDRSILQQNETTESKFFAQYFPVDIENLMVYCVFFF